MGITGGIGSGKTLACTIFGKLGIPVYSADDRARQLIHSHTDLRRSILHAFGEKAFVDGVYNRGYMAEVVFSKRSKLEELNKLVHPVVVADYGEWLKSQDAAVYTLHEAAILFESGLHHLMDYTLYVDAPEELRIHRVTERDTTSREKVVSRIRNQLSADKIRSMADWVINNDENELILPQILRIHEQLINISYTHG